MLDNAFEALKKYDWGTDRAPVTPISDAAAAAHGNPEARKDLESRLLAALKSDISRDAKDYVCRVLTLVGSAAAAPVLSKLLADENHSHMARFALERIPAPEAADALRDALPKLPAKLKIGAISSIGNRGDAHAVSALKGLLEDGDAAVARAAAAALGHIGNAAAEQALRAAHPSSGVVQQAVIDARLACAESLLAVGNAGEALAVYDSLAGDQQPRLVRLAATRGKLACAAKTA
ncbi:MAG: HEAT repeat domain-containing protein [Planctomycetia bacterium]|nr:HEAT repeat domain-containing protein [Planctomycetia bacterium]